MKALQKRKEGESVESGKIRLKSRSKEWAGHKCVGCGMGKCGGMRTLSPFGSLEYTRVSVCVLLCRLGCEGPSGARMKTEAVLVSYISFYPPGLVTTALPKLIQALAH